jgi:hypothetical protein
MPEKTWKRRERAVAQFFGSERTPLSGSGSGHTSSDTLHEAFYVETKHRAKHAIFGLYKDTKKKARKENKIPLICLSQENSKGFLIVIHSEQLDKLMETLLDAKDDTDVG